MMSLGWFLGIVFLFYLLFPFFVFMLDYKRRAITSLVIAIVFAVIAIAYFYNPPFVEKSPQMHNIVYCMPFFVAGGLIYLEREEIIKYGESHRTLITIITIFLSVVYFILMARMNDKYIIYGLELLMFSIWIMYAISSKDVVLNNKATRFLSKISLEMYLAQMFAFRGVQLLHLENYISNETLLYILTSLVSTKNL